ncbi:cytochrome P450 2K1 [Austrofundulus limnaeus]|uniref:Cytochrome P450 2K1 n=1 Tax=Austrofundulus limnaeus TaxID=52670 RepID=A0A2I4AMH4_AUSLI|nr:PREDICTED: cytochrome P450 2K1-like [Austrofundulus limnaeus]
MIHCRLNPPAVCLRKLCCDSAAVSGTSWFLSEHLRLCRTRPSLCQIMALLDVLLQSFSTPLLVVLVLLLTYFLFSANFSSKSLGKEPPGPRGLPVLGNLLQMNLRKPHLTLMQLTKKYGSVFTIHLGPKKVVVLAGYKTVKEALVQYDEEFGERDSLQILHDFNKSQGVLWSNGDSWKEMRRFALTNLRDFGMGKKACEDKITEECQHLMEVLKKFNGTNNLFQRSLMEKVTFYIKCLVRLK